METIKGKKAFVSGATGGIGAAIATKLAACGCDLFLTSSTEKALDSLKGGLSDYGVKVVAQAGDLKREKDVYGVIKAAQNALGQIDILINAAGVFPNKSLFDSDDETYKCAFDINFRSAFIFSRELAKGMVSRRWGRIVNVGSSSAYHGFSGTSMYCATKHALLGFSRAIHDELKEYNVRTLCISPSSTKSNMGLATKGQDYSTFLDPDDVAEYVVFAISFDSNIVSEEIFLKRMVVR